MMALIADVLAEEDVARVCAGLAAAVWRDGKATAGPAARTVKHNLQANGSDEAVQALERFVADALIRNPVFEMAARPAALSRLMFSRYQPGMAYGPHTDDAVMGPHGARLRADVAFTLFLAAPESYDGGALTMHAAAGAQSVKLNAGGAVVYPAGTIHEVEPVTSGERLACVGWAQSLVRDAGAREVLFDLSTLRLRLKAGADEALLLDKSIAALLRRWAEV